MYKLLFNACLCALVKLSCFLFTPARGLKSLWFEGCLKQGRPSVRKDKNMFDCVKQLQKKCESSRVIVIKTIRTEMRLARKLMEELHNLKVIHLVRDPRAVLRSQKEVKQCTESSGGIHGCTRRLCKQLENDLIEEKLILRDSPDRLYPVVYEDIAKQPIKMANRLHEFAGYEFTEKTKLFVYNVTMAGTGNEQPYSTRRSNSSKHIDDWKKAMDPVFVDVIQERCNYLLRHYGFALV